MPMSMSHRAKCVACRTAILIFDLYDSVLEYVSPTRRPASDYEPSDCDALSDEEIAQLRLTAPHLDDPFGGQYVFRVTPRTVVKGCSDFEATEAHTQELVFANTTIPVPRVRRIIPCDEDKPELVMDFIPGRRLLEAWPSLSLRTKLWCALTLRRYIRQLRAIPSRLPHIPPPGPLSTDGPRQCRISLIWGDWWKGPFATYADLSQFFNDWHHRTAQRMNSTCGEGEWRELFDDSEPLALVHLDLNMRNLILGDDGRLWVLDWGWAGFYPRWFEYISMRDCAENEVRVSKRQSDRYPLWEAMVPFICDPYFRQREWLRRIGGILF